MANTAAIADRQDGNRWRTIPTAPFRLEDAFDDERTLMFTRNEVMREALGGRTWRGALTNVTAHPLDEVTVQIRFHDRDGRPVGPPVTARAARLSPGADLYLQARLPSAAVGMQVGSLRWTAGGDAAALGSFDGQAFGPGQT
ncbi:MAG TPA: FxLYD domain-containing protein [Brevundimonas sp.]|nr:FxLYD domain-containing protein [Brevundimonas sp.]